MKYISRIDNLKMHGWYVRLYRNKKTWCSKYFSDKLSDGDHEKSLSLAKKYLKEKRSEFINLFGLSVLRETPPYYTKPFKSNTTTKICGVHKSHEFSRIWPHKEIYYYCATWDENKKPKSKKFYIHKFSSEEEALNEAISHRKMMERFLRRES